MATIKNSINVSGGSIPYLIIVIYKTTAPLAEVDRIVYEHGTDPNPFQFIFSDLESGTYNVVVHESADGTTLGNVRHDYWIDADTNEIVFERRFYTVDGGEANDPVSTAPDDTKLVDPYLDGKTITGVFQEGFRYLIPTVEWEQVAGGQLNWLNGIVNNGGQVWTVEIRYITTVASPPPNDALSTVVIITGDTSLDSSHLNKTLLVRSASNKVTLTLQNLAGVADGKGMIIRHDRGNAINVIVKGFGSDVTRFRGNDKTQVVLGIGEMLKLVKFTDDGDAFWLGQDERGQWERVGEYIGWHSQIKDNAIPVTGGEYDPVTYVRLGEFVDSLDPSLVVTYATYDSTTTIRGEVVFHKRGFFAKDAGTGKIKVPDLRDKHISYLKNIGGADAERVDNIPGGYMHDGLREHWHEGLEAENTSHGSSSTTQVGPNVKLLVNTPPGTVATIANAKVKGVYINGVGAAAAAHTHAKNIGLIPLLLI